MSRQREVLPGGPVAELGESRRGGAGNVQKIDVFLVFVFVPDRWNRATGDKELLNSVPDSIRIPTIWITNTPAKALDESSRRRFDYSIRFDPLNTAQRLAIWRNNVERLNLGHLIDEAMPDYFGGESKKHLTFPQARLYFCERTEKRFNYDFT